MTRFFFTLGLYLMNLSVFAETVCLNMIVKNEKDVIERCLSSVAPLIDTWVIVDTGSTDGTQEIIRKFFREKNIPGELHEKPWVNFEHNRNEALQLAKKKADYLLMIDADDQLAFPKDFKLPLLTKDFYVFPVHVESLQCMAPRLVKAHLDWYWRGVIHEELTRDTPTQGGILPEIEYIYNHDGARSKDPETYRKDLAILLEAVRKDPNNARNFFFLGMTYLRVGDLEKALEIHKKRSGMPGFEEETFLSMLLIGDIQASLQQDPKIVMESFLKAHLFRPHRAEPLYCLLEQLKLHKEYEKGYEVARYAIQTRLTNTDTLFVERWMHDFGILMEYAFFSIHTQRFSEGLEACKTLLARKDLQEKHRKEIESLYESGNQMHIERIQHRLEKHLLF